MMAPKRVEKENGQVKTTGDAAAEGRRLLSISELSGVIQVPVQTLYQWRQRGEGPPPIRLGRHLRFDPKDVDRWIDARKAASSR